MRMTALEEYQQHRRKLKRIVRHYRLYSGDILCGQKRALEATSVYEGVTCKRCLKALIEMKAVEKKLEEGIEQLDSIAKYQKETIISEQLGNRERRSVEMECPKCGSQKIIPCIDEHHQHCRDCGHIFIPKK